MGQQQLLLLVLGIVIVGLAVVVGIQAFGENQKKANADALVNDAIRIASDAQAWKLKPAAFGGGGSLVGDANFEGLEFEQLGYSVTDLKYVNLNGEFTMDATDGGVTITGTNAQNENEVEVVVSGTAPEDILTTVTNLVAAAP
jgi:hypothetical protein